MSAACEGCGSAFVPGDNKGKPTRFCSRACGCRATGKRHAGTTRNPPHVFVCPPCGKTVSTYHRAQKFCSSACSGQARFGRRMQRGRCGGGKDKNQPEIVRAFEAMGASVIDFSEFGRGVPDLLVGMLGVTHWVEVKNPETHYGRTGLNPRQQLFADEWRGEPVLIARTVDEVVQLVQNWRRGKP